MPAAAHRKHFLLRIDPEVFAALQHWARDELRSANGQIEFALDDALRRAGRHPHSSKGSQTDPKEVG